MKVIYSFEALRAELALGHPAPLMSTASEDFFCTLAWFENLALHGLAADEASTTTPYLLLISDEVNNNKICLPLLNGLRLTSLSNYYTSLFGPVILPPETSAAHTPMVWDAVARHLHQAPSRWPVITLSPLDTDSGFYQQFSQALRKAGYWVDHFFCFGNWYLAVASRSFDQYYGERPSALRHSIERGQRRLTKSGEWSIHIHQSADLALDTAIADFESVYQQSWKVPEPNKQFIPGLIRMAATQGWLRLGVLKLEGRAIAAQLWLVKDKKASIYKLAYVNGFERLSVGSVLTSALMRHAIDVDQVQEVDYLTGDDAYKQSWMSHRRERWGIVGFRPGTWCGFWAGCRHFSGKALRKITRQDLDKQTLDCGSSPQ